jgi:alkanesulfonate monooxygenase SsuD/methylene tetrahydromethanopterin reductase-like flavin-dependent oxidoreductase (luciferase family)
MLGIGAAWYAREHAGLGVPFPPTAERFERLEETLQICRRMWGPETDAYTGTHYRLAEPVCVPAPVRAGGPRVLVGGSGERRTLRLVARYADACNLYDFGPDEVARKLHVLDDHCEAEGRDPAEVQRTVIVNGDPLDDEGTFWRRMQAYAALGVDQVWVSPPAHDPAGGVEALCTRVLPRLAELG